MTRNRDRKGSLLVHGRKRKFWLVQWPEGDRRPSHKLGWRDEMTASQAERARRQWMEKINQVYRKERTGRGTSFRQAVNEHACGYKKGTLRLDHVSTAARKATCWRSEGHLTD